MIRDETEKERYIQECLKEIFCCCYYLVDYSKFVTATMIMIIVIIVVGGSYESNDLIVTCMHTALAKENRHCLI